MILTDYPFSYRETSITTTCKCCENTVNAIPTIHPIEYEELPSYYDNFRKGMEEDFFRMKFIQCDKCGNFGLETLYNDYYKTVSDEKIKEIFNSDRPPIEKSFIIYHLVHKDTASLLELYWYFDFKKPDSEELKLCREALIKRYEEKLNEITKNRKVTPTSKMELENAILMLIELYRRNGDFETAISHYKKYKSLSSPYAHKIMKEQVHLIKHKDKNRH